MGSTDVNISNNIIRNLYGIHGNGISIYLDNANVIVSRNNIFQTTRPLTFHGDKQDPNSENMLKIDGNIFSAESPSASAALTSFGNTHGVAITNNVLIGPKAGALLSSSDTDLTMTDNYLSGVIIKGEKPSEWIIRDNGRITKTHLKMIKQLSETPQ